VPQRRGDSEAPLEALQPLRRQRDLRQHDQRLAAGDNRFRDGLFNVAIRTTLIDRKTKTAEYGVGGGIVWDSTSKDEYAEALLKARVLTETTPTFSLLETMMWSPNEGYFLREKHIRRLLESADYFDFKISREQIENHIDQISSKFIQPQRVRLLLDKYGKLSSEAKPFQTQNDHLSLRVRLAKNPVHSGNIFLFHKTTHREVYDFARKDFHGYDDVLLYNENRELTEFTIGNLVAEIDGRLYTPPVSCGLLAGTFRDYLLKSGRIAERIIQVDEMKKCTKVFLINSVRRWQNVTFESSQKETGGL
jgi:para-aminobenzoate synthetase/4-amino-4-deoxychorismate lyase